MIRKNIIIIGAGPSGLMAADVLSRVHNVSVYDKEPKPGQKFLLAGKGGFNLTSDLEGEELNARYLPAGFMDKILLEFDSRSLRQWFSELGINTFVGSSGRVFPEKNIKPIDILNRIIAKLSDQGVVFHQNHELVGFDGDNRVVFKYQQQQLTVEADYIILALGGASWPQTGSDGLWCSIMESMGVATLPFQSSNCGINVNWPESVVISHVGKPLKNIKLSAHNTEALGEAKVTEYGLEGNAIYPLIPAIRNMIDANDGAIIYIDFKPSNTLEQLLDKTKGRSIKPEEYREFFHLNSVQSAIIKAFTNKDTYLSLSAFIQSIKKLPIPIVSLRPVAEAISSIGGLPLGEINDDFSLKKYPRIYCIGEMLNWDAPTGGFLIQGCFSMGNYVAKSITIRTQLTLGTPV